MIANAFILALREIRNNLMRAALTTLGIVIGVAAVIAMVTLGSGATKSVTSDIASMGRNLLILVPGERRPGTLTSASAFTLDDAAVIARDVTGLAAVAPAVSRSGVALAGNRNHTTQITGTTNAFFTAREWPMALGRGFSLAEDRAGKAVCVLGETVRKDLFGTQDPVGARIRVDKVSCDVIGVLSAKGQSTFGQDQDDYVMMPLRTVQRRLAGNTDVTMIWISVASAPDTNRAKADIERLMRERRHIQTGAADDFQVSDMAEVTKMVESTTAILTAFLSAVAAVSLLVGGIGIMNVMLVSVTERTREIGIRLAIGAREHDVLLQFLIEAVVMSALGGIIGIALGLLGSFGASAALKLPFVFEPSIVVIAVLFSAAVGVAFGYFPARRAARLDPIEALRHE
ncbi:MAG TPA: ABC transporter permease [Rhizomicrobium sp.]|jgi:putative ABC transport system permease protein|nr:ABC transporter permease [Rhizomicrobium sp.]